MKKTPFKYLLASIFLLSLSSCISVKPYEQIFVNDPEMKMEQDASKNFSNYVSTIREGATPIGTQKSSGGCGCN